jgi:hypothetical protein
MIMRRSPGVGHEYRILPQIRDCAIDNRKGHVGFSAGPACNVPKRQQEKVQTAVYLHRFLDVRGLHDAAYPRAVGPQRAPGEFTALWTLKEAFVKAIGKGFRQPFRSFSINLSEPAGIAFPDGGSAAIENPRTEPSIAM